MATFATNPAADPITGSEKIPLSQGGVDKQASPRDLMIQLVNAQTGTTYTYLASDKAKLVSHANGASIAGTLPEAASPDFPAGWWMDVQNTGAGTLTITPTTSTIDGAASLVLATGQGVRIASDGTNYFTMRGMGGGIPDAPNDGTLYGRKDGAWEAVPPSVPAPVVTESTTALTADGTNAGNYTRFTNAGAKTYSFDDAETYAVDAEYHGRNVGAGDLTLTEVGSFVINPPAGGTLVIPQGATFTVKIVDAAEADLFGVTVAL